MARYVVGVSGLYHDAAAAVLRDGEILAAVQEERLSRRKHDPSLPRRSLAAVLDAAGVRPGQIEVLAYYEKPLGSLARVLKTFATVGPRGLRAFPGAMEEALRRKIWVGYDLDRAVRELGFGPPGRIVYAEHHVSHAAAAFYPSPFEDAAVVTLDGVGEWTTTSIGAGHGRRLDLLREIRFPHSLGLVYSAFTAAAGFEVNDGEYKLMGLAPYGRPTYRDRILAEVLDLRDDGSFTVHLDLLDYLAGRRMTNRAFDAVFDGPPRRPGDPITVRECDLARSVQDVAEEVVLRTVRHAHELTGADALVLGGGVALNVVANGRVRREGPYRDVWVQPAAGDAGSALGAALWAWHEVLGEPRTSGVDRMAGALLGPRPLDGLESDPTIEGSSPPTTSAWLAAAGRPHQHLPDPAERHRRVAELLDAGEVVALCTGRLEFGPRALGSRSILADPRDPTMQERINGEVKRREDFRPFAPVVLAERADAWFDLDGPSPYMAFVVPVREAVPAVPPDGNAHDVADLAAVRSQVRSPLPAVTHVDGSARVQTVDEHTQPELHGILSAFEARTGCPVLVNTSFNVRGEPIVASAEDAYRCFVSTGIDHLLLEDCLIDRRAQPET